MNQLTVLTPTGCIGNRGMYPEAFINALEESNPQVMAVDGGSFDLGPYYLGKGLAHSPLTNIRQDLDLILTEGVGKRGIPFVVGSAGGSGGKPHVDLTLEMVKEIAARRNLDFKVGVIYSDVTKEYLLDRVRRGDQIKRVPTELLGDPLTEEQVSKSSVIVAMMGVEPIIEAFKRGADVVIAGRAADSCVIAAYPIMKGFDKGLSMQMGDIMECGEAALVDKGGVRNLLGPNRMPVVGIVQDDHFVIKAGHPGMVCTVESASAHSLYERESHSEVELPGGILSKSETRYEQLTESVVKVSGSRFNPKPYTVLLEGVGPAGWRTITVMGVRNPRMIDQIDDILAQQKRSVEARFGEIGKFSMYYHLYGKGAVLGQSEWRNDTTPFELGLVIDVVGETQELANDVSEDLLMRIAHCRYPGRTTTAGNVARLFSPNAIDAGEAYDTTIYHQMPIDDPLELFDISVRGIHEV